jgi:uncharacterized protein (DUF58 family)
MLSPEIIKQIRKIQIQSGHLVTDALAGNYTSAFKGQGMEFDNVREYYPGDDVRGIDWNVTARMNTPFIKVLREERELTLMLMVDVSASQWVGTAGSTKQEIAAELAGILAFLATKNNDKVGLIVFSDHVEKYIPPQKGRAHIWTIIRSVMTHEAKGSSTDINVALDYLQSVSKRKSVCFLISDFLADDFEQSMKLASRRHDLTCVRVKDPIEESVQGAGFVAFQDSETGEAIILDTSNKKVRSAYKASEEKREEELCDLFNKNGINTFKIVTDTSVVRPFVNYMRLREKRRRRK